jgi:hypothetical protein
MGCSGPDVVGDEVRIGVLIGQVRPRDAGAEEGASGPVMIGKVMPKELGTSEKKARHEMIGVGCLMGRA